MANNICLVTMFCKKDLILNVHINYNFNAKSCNLQTFGVIKYTSAKFWFRVVCFWKCVYCRVNSNWAGCTAVHRCFEAITWKRSKFCQSNCWIKCCCEYRWVGTQRLWLYPFDFYTSFVKRITFCEVIVHKDSRNLQNNQKVRKWSRHWKVRPST